MIPTMYTSHVDYLYVYLIVYPCFFCLHNLELITMLWYIIPLNKSDVRVAGGDLYSYFMPTHNIYVILVV